MPVPDTLKAELLFDAGAILGEGPLWEHKSGMLYWVDIEGCRLHRYEPLTGRNRAWEFDGMPGAVIPAKDGRLILAHEKGLMLFDPVSGETQALGLLENADPRLRFNDGKCDPFGNIWIGTMDKGLAPSAGKLYRIDSRQHIAVMLNGTTVSNGMTWSPDNRYMYYTDSPTRQIWRFDYDRETAAISNRKIVIDIPEELGVPDGMTIDRKGMLWIAHWGGNCVRQWDPGTGEILRTVTVDAPNVTSCCFGGPELDMLYITTAQSGLNAAERAGFPLSGGLFFCRPGARGTDTGYYNLTI